MSFSHALRSSGSSEGVTAQHDNEGGDVTCHTRYSQLDRDPSGGGGFVSHADSDASVSGLGPALSCRLVKGRVLIMTAMCCLFRY